MKPRPPGRPPLDPTSREPSAPVCLKLSATDFDRADKLAHKNRETLQDVIRRGLRRLLDAERGGAESREFRNTK